MMAAKTVQVNIRLEEELAKELDELVVEGVYNTRTEAVRDAIKSLLRERIVERIRVKMERVRATSPTAPVSLTRIIEEAHEEEDEL